MLVSFLGYTQSFPMALCCIFPVQWELIHLPLAEQVNHLCGHIVPWELSMGIALFWSPSPLQLGCPSVARGERTGHRLEGL